MAGNGAERWGEKKDRVWRKMREPGVRGETLEFKLSMREQLTWLTWDRG